ncbi:MAG: hypothetical protein ACJAS1_002611 [Oleiphilaceae bacterium]|jgi:hypothetical protein
MAMSQKVDMNVFLHSLLVIKQMNEFTVIEAKDALLHEHAEFTDSTEARKFMYRQLLWGINNGLLKRTDHFNSGIKEVLYSKTEKFFASTIVPIKRRGRPKKSSSPKITKQEPKTINYQALLEKELMTYEIDLNASIEEAKEYKRLSTRFPELKEKLQQHQLQAKNQSTQLLGKVHALQKLLGYTATGYQPC